MFFIVGLINPAHIGSGDSVQPTDTVSIIRSVTPEPRGAISVSIVGGDTFVRVKSNGAAVQIPGYENEPYLKIDANGIVSVNERSISSFVNSTRYGATQLPDITSPAPAVWRVVARDGTAIWHDHRSHWMSAKRPAVIDSEGTVLNWQIPIIVNGTTTVIAGTLYLQRSASAWWWLLGIPLLLIAAVATSLQRQRSAVVALVVSLATLIVGWFEYVGLPDSVRTAPTMIVFSVISMFIAVFALLRNRDDSTDGALCAGSGMVMMLLAWLVREQIYRAYIPGLDAEWCARTVIIACLSSGLVLTLDGARRVLR